MNASQTFLTKCHYICPPHQTMTHPCNCKDGRHTTGRQKRNMTAETQHDGRFMAEALKEARKAEAEGEIPIGAVVVCEGRIIARAHNQTETLHDPTAHAEMLAMTAATAYIGGKYLPECTIYVTVEPCPMCAAAMAWTQVGALVYGADDPKRGYTLFSPSLLHPRTKVTRGVLSGECSSVMTEFFKKIRR